MQTQTPMPRQMSDARHLTTYTRYWIRHTGLDPLFRPRDLDTYADTDPESDTDPDADTDSYTYTDTLSLIHI